MNFIKKHNGLVSIFLCFCIFLPIVTNVYAMEITHQQHEYKEQNTIKKKKSEFKNACIKTKINDKEVRINIPYPVLIDEIILKEIKKNNMNNLICNEAKKLVGITNGRQCTDVATMALNNAGISADIVYPDQYLSYGKFVPQEEAEAGNLIYYNNGGRGVDHIAIYIGDGMAVHGNFDGQTIISSIYINGGYPQFIQINY